MKKFTLGFVALLSLLSLSPESFGQFNRKAIKKNNKRIATFTGKKRFSREHVYSGVGFSINALNYYGDLSPLPSKFSTDISFTKPGFGISFFHRFGPRYTLVAQYMYGSMSGSDGESASGDGGSFRRVRNLSFRNRIHELSVTGIFDLFENNGTYISRVKWTPYALVGVAVFYHNPQAQAPKTYLDGTPNPKAGEWVDLQPLGTEGQNSTLLASDANVSLKPYSLLQVAIPFGVGARFRLNEVLDLWADIGFRYTFTDYLDDVSGNYVDLGVFKDPLAQAMSYRSNEVATATSSYTGRDGKIYNVVNGYGSEFPDNNRGNKRNNDIYMVTSIKITYILGATFHRAKFR